MAHSSAATHGAQFTAYSCRGAQGRGGLARYPAKSAGNAARPSPPCRAARHRLCSYRCTYQPCISSRRFLSQSTCTAFDRKLQPVGGQNDAKKRLPKRRRANSTVPPASSRRPPPIPAGEYLSSNRPKTRYRLVDLPAYKFPEYAQAMSQIQNYPRAVNTPPRRIHDRPPTHGWFGAGHCTHKQFLSEKFLELLPISHQMADFSTENHHFSGSYRIHSPQLTR